MNSAARPLRLFPLNASLLILCLALAACATPKSKPRPAPPSFEAVEAASAYDFVNSIGVNIHLHYTDTVYFERFEDVIKPRLLELGVRHVRDGIYTYELASRETFYYARMRELISAGLRPTLITSIGIGNYNESTNYSRLEAAYGWLDGEVEAFEGINEPDVNGPSDWAAQTRAAQRQLFETVQASSAMRGTPVLGPSVAWKAEELGDLSSYLTHGNIHPYADGLRPERQDYGVDVAGSLARAEKVSGGEPVMATEAGYHNAVNTGDAHRGVSERAAAAYLPRLLFYHFGAGVKRTFLYELIDLRPDPDRNMRDHNFGLLRHDGTPKPGFEAVKNLVALLADETDAAPGSLTYRLTGPSDLRSLLLQKRGGRFYLALWRGVPSFDTEAKRDLSPAAETVNVAFKALPGGLRIHHFDKNGEVTVSPAAGEALGLELADTLVVVEVTP